MYFQCNEKILFEDTELEEPDRPRVMMKLRAGMNFKSPNYGEMVRAYQQLQLDEDHLHDDYDKGILNQFRQTVRSEEQPALHSLAKCFFLVPKILHKEWCLSK
jgi:hypothetical protein